MGLRLEGTPLRAGREIVSHALVPGAIQLPPDGQPVVILVDGPTVGGYPVLGVVPRAEMPRLGQLRPGDLVRFRAQEPDRARAAWRVQQDTLARAARALAADALWHRLADHAGG
jgi:allophanate hydrolase subunit 2